MCECQGDYITELLGECDYPKAWDTKETLKIFNKWVEAKVNNIMTFRDQTFTSAHTGVTSLAVKTPWLENFE